MNLNAAQDYALRICGYLASEGKSSSLDISEATGVPRDYLIQLAQPMRNAGILDATPGKHGGYNLARPAYMISVLDVVRAVSALQMRDSVGKECKKVDRIIANALCSVSIEDVMA